MKGSISYKVKKQRPPTFNQTPQEIWVCRAYAIHGHSRTENRKHLTALKAPAVIYQEAMKAKRIRDLQIKTLKLEQTTIFLGVAQYLSPKNCNLSLDLSPLNQASLNSNFIVLAISSQQTKISCNLCLRTPSPERSTGISSYLKERAVAAILWPEVGNHGKPMCK